VLIESLHSKALVQTSSFVLLGDLA